LASKYDRIASVSNTSLEFLDTNDGWGLTPGNTYCYRIISKYAENTPSYISDEVCIEIEPTLSAITNVSVQQTDCGAGHIYIAWTTPFAIDTNLYKPPYRYSLVRTEGFSVQDFTEIAEFL